MKVARVHAHESRGKSPVPGLRPLVKALSYSQYTQFLFMISLSFSTLPSVDTPYPMLILCGPPGSGKRYLARRLCQEFPDFFGFGWERNFDLAFVLSCLEASCKKGVVQESLQTDLLSLRSCWQESNFANLSKITKWWIGIHSVSYCSKSTFCATLRATCLKGTLKRYLTA